MRMHGACLQPPNVCIIYEFVSGGSLHDLIYKQSKPLSCLELLRIGKDIAEGMVRAKLDCLVADMNTPRSVQVF